MAILLKDFFFLRFLRSCAVGCHFYMLVCMQGKVTVKWKFKETNSQNISEAELRFVRLCTDSVVPRPGVIFYEKYNISEWRSFTYFSLVNFIKKKTQKPKPDMWNQKKKKYYLLINFSLLSNSAYTLDLIFPSLQNIWPASNIS